MVNKRTVLRYEGFGVEQGNIIPAEEAEEYALSECGLEVRMRKPMTREAVEWIVDWFFSGSWVPVYEGDENEGL